jgi:hypothetical protein
VGHGVGHGLGQGQGAGLGVGQGAAHPVGHDVTAQPVEAGLICIISILSFSQKCLFVTSTGSMLELIPAAPPVAQGSQNCGLHGVGNGQTAAAPPVTHGQTGMYPVLLRCHQRFFCIVTG